MTRIDAIITAVKDDLQRVEQSLFVSLAEHAPLSRDVSSHVLSSGGKRFRPLLLLLAARLCNYQGENHIPLACVIEYIHTATLLHDDVIDHAQIRRGNASANALWGNHTSILAGDFLLSKAFSMAIEAGNREILRVLSRAATLMVEAELQQSEHSHDPLITETEYLQIITKKTASLIAAASQIGAILAGVNSSKEQALTEYGLNVGIAFQIMDDVLDYASTENDLGKTIGKDLLEGSVTLPLIEALRRSSAHDKNTVLHLMDKGQALDAADLSVIFEIVNKYHGSRGAIEKAKTFVQKAKDALTVFDSADHKTPLLDLATYVVERNN
jgi:octaprenyl-diphosphate synthase